MICEKCSKPISRTEAQNRYFHKILTIWGNDAGYSLEEMKVLVKHELGLYKLFPNKRTGEELIVYESSANWDRGKFARVTEWILHTANTQGIRLLTPGEFYEL